MTLLTEQGIRSTLNSYADDDRASYDALESRMIEVKAQIETARCLLHTAMQEMPSPLTSPAFEAVALANDKLAFALTAWED